MIRTQKYETLQYLTADGITVPHGFTTRLGGVSTGTQSSLNLAVGRGDSLENVEENLRRLGRAVGFDPEKLVMTLQIHSDIVRVVDEYWMDNIDAMDDLKQGIGLRAYGQHDPVIAYKEEGYQMFEAMITAIKEETIRRMFLVQLRPAQEVKREKVAKETGTSAPDKSQVKRAPVRKEHKVGPNDPCPCGSGKKYKKCCYLKDKAAQ